MASSPRRAIAVAIVASAVVIACGGGAGSPPSRTVTPTPGPQEIAFRDEGAAPQGGYDGRTPKIEVVPADGGRRRVTAFMGQQSTGGYSIRIERVTLAGRELRVQARFTSPGPGAIVTQALTSPAHTVSLAADLDEAVLLDQDGKERARAAVR